MTAEKGPGFEPKKILIARCWSCGKPLPEGGKCPDPECNGAPALKVTPPKTVLPFCGQDYSKLKFDGITFKDLPDPKTVEMRACCQCGKSWMCDFHTWVNGVCPHCGAHGYDGQGGKGYTDIKKLTKFDSESLIEKLPDKVNLKDYSSLRKKFEQLKSFETIKKEDSISGFPVNQALVDFLKSLDSKSISLGK